VLLFIGCINPASILLESCLNKYEAKGGQCFSNAPLNRRSKEMGRQWILLLEIGARRADTAEDGTKAGGEDTIGILGEEISGYQLF
jgi:hypothetical protein